MNLNAEQLAAIDEELFAGNVIAAIRTFRGFTGAQLVHAKSFVDDRLDELRNSQPLRFPIPSTPPKPDRQILQQITPLSDRDLRDLRSTLKQTEKLLYGVNYAPTLDVNAATLLTSDLPFFELMVALYPDSTPHDATILPVSTDELVADVTECMEYAGDSSAEPQFTDRRLKELTDTLLPQYWRQLNALAPLESSMLYSYSSDVGLPGYYVFWFFAYLIHCLETNRCVVITGMASD